MPPRTVNLQNPADLRPLLDANLSVRRSLPHGGRLFVDRALPYLCLGKFSPRSRVENRVASLITTQPAYLMFAKDTSTYPVLCAYMEGVVEPLAEQFGTFLIVEFQQKVVKQEDREPDGGIGPNFEIGAQQSSRGFLASTLEIMQSELAKIRFQGRPSPVDLVLTRRKPHKNKVLLDTALAQAHNCHFISLKIAPFFFGCDGSFYPQAFKQFRRRLNRVLQQAFFTFIKENTSYKPPSYRSLGSRSFVKAVWDVDRQLAAIDRSFDFLRLVSPVNTHQAWRLFKKTKYREPPKFYYPPVPFDPIRLKRTLYAVPIDRISDPSLARMLRRKQIELDRQISMIYDRNTPHFLLGSRQLFGRPGPALLSIARDILQGQKPSRKRPEEKQSIKATEVAAHAEAEFKHYQQLHPAFDAQIEIRDDIAGILVSGNTLRISSRKNYQKFRIDGILQHEIGVHLLTYYNGGESPFHLFSCGLDGYEELQEGLAVFAELAVGNLDIPRLRTLAARVLAADACIEGATFIETFELVNAQRFTKQQSFNLVARIFRSGGYTKDAIYLNGFLKLLDYLRQGRISDDVFMGKFSFHHLPLIREFRERKILHEPPLLPRFLQGKKLETLASTPETQKQLQLFALTGGQ